MRKKLLVICNIAKKELEKQEALLAQNQNLIRIEYENIDIVNTEIAQLTPPKAGSFKDFINYKAIIAGFLYQIEESQNIICKLKLEQEEIKINLRQTHLNYEKMQYMYNKQKQMQEKIQSDNDKKMLDELSIILQNHKEKS